MNRVAVLGSTGSIGTQALSVIAANPRRLKAALLTCRNRVDMLRGQIDRYRPQGVVVERREDAAELRREYPGLHVFFGSEGMLEAIGTMEFDVMLNALVGISGLAPTLAGIRRGGIRIALANKETLVTAGRLVTQGAAAAGVPVIPVDSEHSAIFQCLSGNRDNPIRRIILTASGGPFRGFSRARLAGVTASDALLHPQWRMGRKITIDSATMVNKGFEIIEAKWLYDLAPGRIDVAVHPQSIIHSLVEFEDGALLAQLSAPDMRIPISYAFSYPERWAADTRGLDLVGLQSLHFEAPSGEGKRSLDLAYRLLRESEEKGKDSGAVVFNGANEALVERFLGGRIPFLAIVDTLDELLARHESRALESAEDIAALDLEARAAVAQRFPE